MLPLISVIIPTYNHAHFLEIALQSVIDQTYQNWEIIVVDNHSSDNTDEVVDKFSSHNIRLLKINNNGVIGASRNLGINSAKGEWIAFLDSDDFWYKNKLEKSINSLKEVNDASVISTDELLVNKISNKKQILRHGPYCDEFYKQLLLTGNRLSTSATLVKKIFLENQGILFRQEKEFVTAEDYDFWMLLAHASAIFVFVPSVQGEYIIHSSNHSSQISRHFASVESVMRNHVFHKQKFTLKKNALWRFVRARFQLNSAYNLLRQGSVLTAFGIISITLFKNPLGVIAYFRFILIKKQIF